MKEAMLVALEEAMAIGVQPGAEKAVLKVRAG
jgi:hypothetical protein